MPSDAVHGHIPRVLPDNTGLVFPGESSWPAALLTDREADKMMSAVNPCGRPNTDVLRRRLAVSGGEPVESWQIDFPEHFTAQEAALYEQPFALLRKRTGGVWQNPHAAPALRRALARVSRWLALPAAAETPDWRWIEDELLPDESLMIVARDDDFMHGMLASPLFALWWGQHRAQPVLAVGSFPFPWPPATPLSALSKIQEEQRHAIARAVRGGDIDALNDAAPAAYGWPTDLSDAELLARLTTLNRERGGLSSR